MKPTQSQGLQAIYRISELAEMAGIAKKRMARLLDQCGVEYIRFGRDKGVPITELEKKCGSMWDAAKFAHHLRKIERERYERILARTEELESHVTP